MSTPVDVRALGQELSAERSEPPPAKPWWEPLRALALIVVAFVALIFGGTKLWAWIQTWEPDPLPPGPAGRVSVYADPTINEDGQYVLARGELRGSFWEIGVRPDGLTAGRAICIDFTSDGYDTEMCGITGPDDALPSTPYGEAAPRGHVESLFWALCDPAVTSFEVRLQGGVVVPGHVTRLPEELGLDHGFYVASFAGDLPGTAVGYDASGEIVARFRL